MSLLVAIEAKRGPRNGQRLEGDGSKAERKGMRPEKLQLEMTLHELAELFAVFVAHVHEFDAAAVRPDVADHGSEIDLAETRADFQLDRVADGELPRRFQIRAAEADGLHARKTGRSALDLSTKRRFQRHAHVTPGHEHSHRSLAPWIRRLRAHVPRMAGFQ